MILCRSHRVSKARMLEDYTNYMSKYTKAMQELGEIDDHELSSADAAYYLEVQSRITKKLYEAEQ